MSKISSYQKLKNRISKLEEELESTRMHIYTENEHELNMIKFTMGARISSQNAMWMGDSRQKEHGKGIYSQMSKQEFNDTLFATEDPYYHPSEDQVQIRRFNIIDAIKAKFSFTNRNIEK